MSDYEYEQSVAEWSAEDMKAADNMERRINLLREAYKRDPEGTRKKLEDSARYFGIDINSGDFLNAVTMSEVERQKDYYYKTDLSDQPTIIPREENEAALRSMKAGDTIEVAGCKITCIEPYDREINNPADWFQSIGDKIAEGWTGLKSAKFKCESDYLGTFEFDPVEFKIGYKQIQEADGTFSQLPVLDWTGFTRTTGTQIKYWTPWEGVHDTGKVGDITINIPDGVKNIDYTFAGKTNLEYFPNIPDSVESAHCAFKGCTRMTTPSEITYNSDTDKIYLPDGLKDMSMMFTGCSDLQGEIWTKVDGEKVNQLPSSSVNITGIFAGCEKIEDPQTKTPPGWLEPAIDLVTAPLTAAGVGKLAGLGGVTLSKAALSASLKEAGKNAAELGIKGTAKVAAGKMVKVSAWLGLSEWSTSSTTKSIAENTLSGTAMFMGMNKLPEFGGDVTPDLAEEFMRDAFAGISFDNQTLYEAVYGEDPKEYIRTRKFNIDDGRDTTEPKSVSGTSVKHTKQHEQSTIASLFATAGESMEAYVPTDMELASAFVTSDNKIRINQNNDSSAFVNDLTGGKMSQQQKREVKDSVWEQIVMGGGIGLLTGGIVGRVSDNKFAGLAAGVGGVALLNHFKLLPTTVQPVLEFTANILPDGAIKNKLLEWRNKLSGYEARSYNEAIDAKNKEIAEYNKQFDDPRFVADHWKDRRLAYAFSKAEEAAIYNMGEHMSENAKFAAKATTFIAVANAGEESASCINDVLTFSCDAIAQQWVKDVSAAGGINDDIKDRMQSYYVSLMGSVEAYSKGALEGTKSNFAANTDDYVLSGCGANMVNRAALNVIVPALKAADDKYHFMDDNAWSKIESMNIAGVDIENIRNYDKNYFDDLKRADAETVLVRQSQDKESKHDDKTVDTSMQDHPVSDRSESVNPSEPKNTSGIVREIPYEEADFADLSEPVKA